jgi:glycosyltransferase involved in cell wall biosynthesis
VDKSYLEDVTFIVPCHNIWPDGYIVPCIKSIRETNPKANIVVVDSDSPDKSYMDKVDCEVLDAGNKHYDFGAYWIGFRHTDSKYYMMVHDSCKFFRPIKKSDFFLRSFTPFYWFPNNNNNWDTLCWARGLAKEHCGYEPKDEDSNNEVCIYAGIFSATSEYLEELEKDNFPLCLPSNKIEMVYVSEYLWALAAHNKGINVVESSYYGRFPGNPNTPGKILHKYSGHVQRGRS